jgi:hypothetical protein
MTTRADFAAEEWNLLVQTPRWVVAAASAAQQDLAYRTNHEIEQGFCATANGRLAGNAFVTEVAAETMKIFDSRSVVGPADFADRAAGIDATLSKVETVARLLSEKAAPPDAAAYQAWLVDITDVVIRAARSHDFIGLGGELVTKAERGFRERLREALGHRGVAG